MPMPTLLASKELENSPGGINKTLALVPVEAGLLWIPSDHCASHGQRVLCQPHPCASPRPGGGSRVSAVRCSGPLARFPVVVDYSAAFSPIRIDLPMLDLAVLDHSFPGAWHFNPVLRYKPALAVVRRGC